MGLVDVGCVENEDDHRLGVVRGEASGQRVNYGEADKVEVFILSPLGRVVLGESSFAGWGSIEVHTVKILYCDPGLYLGRIQSY